MSDTRDVLAGLKARVTEAHQAELARAARSAGAALQGGMARAGVFERVMIWIDEAMAAAGS